MRKPRQFDNNWPRDPHLRGDTEKSMFLAKKAFLL